MASCAYAAPTPRSRPTSGDATCRTSAATGAGAWPSDAATLTYLEAGRQALAEEMRRDPMVWALGEDLGRGGVFGQYRGLLQAFGPERIADAPISEAASWAPRSAPR